MTATIREQVLSATQAALEAITSPPNIFRNRSTVVMPSEMPAVVLYDGAESVGAEGEFSTGRMVYLTLDLETWVSSTKDENLGPDLNDLSGKLITALMNAEAINNGAASVAIDTRYDGMDQPVVDRAQGSRPFIGAVLRFTVQYQVAARDPTSQG